MEEAWAEELVEVWPLEVWEAELEAVWAVIQVEIQDEFKWTTGNADTRHIVAEATRINLFPQNSWQEQQRHNSSYKE